MSHVIVSVSDIHFGATDPQYMYNELQTQFINRISNINFDVLAICGDLFDSKYMSNNPIISYTLSFIDNLIRLCTYKNATLIIIAGTAGHDSGQLSLFYHYLADPTIDLRIVEDIRFEEAKGLRILCIPELSGVPEEKYQEVLYYSGGYDLCLLHGTFRGSFHGSEIATLKSNSTPIFSINNFINCAGPILMGHYHISGCYEGYAYYHGSTFRYKFGEEQEKGFLVTLYDQSTRYHYTQLIPVKSHSYVTININDLLHDDPHKIIEFIKSYKESHNIDYIRVQFNNASENMNIVRNYFRNKSDITLQELERQNKQLEQINQTILEQNAQYSYMVDPAIDDYHKFVMYINQCEGREFISVEELMNLLEGGS